MTCAFREIHRYDLVMAPASPVWDPHLPLVWPMLSLGNADPFVQVFGILAKSDTLPRFELGPKPCTVTEYGTKLRISPKGYVIAQRSKMECSENPMSCNRMQWNSRFRCITVRLQSPVELPPPLDLYGSVNSLLVYIFPVASCSPQTPEPSTASATHPSSGKGTEYARKFAPGIESENCPCSLRETATSPRVFRLKKQKLLSHHLLPRDICALIPRVDLPPGQC